MVDQGSAGWFATKIGNRSANGIAFETRALIRAGALPVGSRLPPVRDLAVALGVSPATIAAAWSELQKLRILDGRGRNGTWVIGDRSITAPTRFVGVGNYGEGVLDLTLAVPDTALLPSLAKALSYGAQAEGLNSYARVSILPRLEEALRPVWPYQPEAMLATNGGYSAIYTLLHALSLHGASVAIEDPTALRHLDILENLGVNILPVRCDSEGPRPDALAEAIARKPAVFLYQPRLHSVTGQTVSPRRMAEMAAILGDADTVVIEDDGLGDIASTPTQSLGAVMPDRVVHVQSFSKTLGPDLRIAVLSGPREILDQVKAFRSFSSGWTSRILQEATAWLLADSQTQDVISTARSTYAARRAALVGALRERGVMAEHGEGLAAWVPVHSETFAVVTLAARGIAASPGTRFSLLKDQRLRVTTGVLDQGQVDRVAVALHLAASEP